MEIRVVMNDRPQLISDDLTNKDAPAVIDDLYFSSENRLRFIYPINNSPIEVYQIIGDKDNKKKISLTILEASAILRKYRIILPVKKIFLGWLKLDKFNYFGYVEHIIDMNSNKSFISAEFEVRKEDFNDIVIYLRDRFGENSVVTNSVFHILTNY
jgi:hypothetical protein